jgi:hypothetical protein
LLLLAAVNDDCGSPDSLGHSWLKLKDKLGPSSSSKPGAAVAMPDGPHILFQIGRGQQAGW